MCWNPPPSKETFACDEASQIAVKLCFKVADEIEKWKVRAEKAERQVFEYQSDAGDIPNTEF